MGTDNLFHKRKTDDFQRKSGNRGMAKDRILIVCEGEKTEPNYFKSFPVTSASVRIEGEGKNTTSLIKVAIKLKKEAETELPFDQVWCVFDRDSFPSKNFNSAFLFAYRNNIRIAYSNISFELWYLLHFNYLVSALSGEVYIEKLEEVMKQKYTKNSKSMYEKLLEKQDKAVANAKKLFDSYPQFDPNKNNPSTTVHLLVEELNRFL